MRPHGGQVQTLKISLTKHTWWINALERTDVQTFLSAYTFAIGQKCFHIDKKAFA